VLASSVVLDATLLPQPRPEYTESGAGGLGSGAGRLLPLSPWDLPRLSGSCSRTASPTSWPGLMAAGSTAAPVCKSKRAPAPTGSEAEVDAPASRKLVAGAAKSNAKTVSGRPQEPTAQVPVCTEQMAAKKRPREHRAHLAHLLSEPQQAVDGSHGEAEAGASANEEAQQVRRKRRGEDERGEAKGVGVESEMKVKEEVQGERASARAEDLHGVRRYSKTHTHKTAAARAGGGGGGKRTVTSSGTCNQSGGGSVRPPVGGALCGSNDKHKGSARKAARDAAGVEASVEAATVLLAAAAAAAEKESGAGGSKRRTRASVAQEQQCKKLQGCQGAVTRHGGVRGGVCVGDGESEHIDDGVPREATQQSEKVIMVCGTEAERKQLAAAIVTLGGATSVSSHYFDMDATHVLTTRHNSFLGLSKSLIYSDLIQKTY